jgi:hypothetical protein
LTALICIENNGPAIAIYRFLECINTKAGVHAI